MNKKLVLGIIAGILLMFVIFSGKGETEKPVDKDDPNLNVVWKVKIAKKTTASPVFDQKNVYMADKNKDIIAVDKISGEKVWSFKMDYPASSQGVVIDNMVLYNDLIYLYALDKDSGNLLWKFDTGTKSDRIFADQWDYYSSSAMVKDGKIYLNSMNGMTFIIDPKTGNKLKEYDTSIARNSPVVKDDVLYVSGETRVVAIDLKTDKLLWSHKVKGKQCGTPVVYNRKLFTAGRDTLLTALDIKTGEIVWQFKEKSGSWFTADLVEHNGKLYVGASDAFKLFVFDPETGKEIGGYAAAHNIFAKPVVTDNYLVLADGDAYQREGRGSVYIFNIKDKTTEKLNVNSNVFGSPALDENNKTVYFPTDKGYLYAVKIK